MTIETSILPLNPSADLVLWLRNLPSDAVLVDGISDTCADTPTRRVGASIHAYKWVSGLGKCSLGNYSVEHDMAWLMA